MPLPSLRRLRSHWRPRASDLAGASGEVHDAKSRSAAFHSQRYTNRQQQTANKTARRELGGVIAFTWSMFHLGDTS
jgi:hypothetical protein